MATRADRAKHAAGNYLRHTTRSDRKGGGGQQPGAFVIDPDTGESIHAASRRARQLRSEGRIVSKRSGAVSGPESSTGSAPNAAGSIGPTIDERRACAQAEAQPVGSVQVEPTPPIAGATTADVPKIDITIPGVQKMVHRFDALLVFLYGEQFNLAASIEKDIAEALYDCREYVPTQTLEAASKYSAPARLLIVLAVAYWFPIVQTRALLQQRRSGAMPPTPPPAAERAQRKWMDRFNLRRESQAPATEPEAPIEAGTSVRNFIGQPDNNGSGAKTVPGAVVLDPREGFVVR